MVIRSGLTEEETNVWTLQRKSRTQSGGLSLPAALTVAGASTGKSE